MHFKRSRDRKGAVLAALRFSHGRFSPAIAGGPANFYRPYGASTILIAPTVVDT
jgi:hypothetical protein